jgi:hypothetical protein
LCWDRRKPFRISFYVQIDCELRRLCLLQFFSCLNLSLLNYCVSVCCSWLFRIVLRQV